MEFQSVVDRRRMVRDFADAPVDPRVVDRALHNATRAPSAGFSQGWGFLVLDSEEAVRRWWTVTASAESLAQPDKWLTGMMRAPVVVVPCSSKAAYLSRYAERDKQHTPQGEDRWSMPYWHMDTAMASLLILQTVVDEGLGACFFGIPTDRVGSVRSAFGVPAEFDPVGAIAIGHRATTAGNRGSATRRPRRPPSEVIHRGRWSQD